MKSAKGTREGSYIEDILKVISLLLYYPILMIVHFLIDKGLKYREHLLVK